MLNQSLDVFASLNSHGVRYLVIGGIAAIVHGVPRATFDLDILIEASPENARCLLDALAAVQFGTASLITPEELLAHEITVFKIGNASTCKRPRRASRLRTRDLAVSR